MAFSIHVFGSSAGPLAEAISAKAPERVVKPLLDRPALDAALPDVEVLFAIKPPRTGWARAARLRLIQLLGAGADMLLPSPDLPADVQVAGVRGVFAPEVAEFAVASMVALARDFRRIETQQTDRVFRQFPGDRLAGRTVGILGLGAIGARVARVCSALEMRVLGVSRTGRVSAELGALLEAHAVSDIDAVLAQCDYLVVALPRTPQTERLIDARRLAMLPAGARLVVVARGGIVDESALGAALRSGHLAGAALDVFESEPLSVDDPTWHVPNLRISPHLAGLGNRYIERCVDTLLDNTARLERGAALPSVIDRVTNY